MSFCDLFVFDICDCLTEGIVRFFNVYVTFALSEAQAFGLLFESLHQLTPRPANVCSSYLSINPTLLRALLPSIDFSLPAPQLTSFLQQAQSLSNSPVHHGAEVLIGHVGVLVDAQAVGVKAGIGLSVVLLDVRLVRGIRLHVLQLAELVDVGLAMGQLELGPFVHIHPSAESHLGQRQSQEDTHDGLSKMASISGRHRGSVTSVVKQEIAMCSKI